MNVRNVCEGVYYIGVNDRTTRLFEGLWPLPTGVSYNSYLVTGSKHSAIIDGVELSHAAQQIAHIRAILGDREPDYLIINHMEPDHSGAISLLRREFPDMLIVGNALTLGMVKGFYDIDDKVLSIKDGDTLELGDGCTLRFFMTPMVHWPETMMTYMEDKAVLFSGDAFGCFGALNGAVLDTEMETSRYMPEMVRYYSNIVGKYGAFVQKALAKLADIQVSTICSTHGPVWRAHAGEVVRLYDTLSRYESLDEGVTIVYGSMYGHTEQLAEAVADALADAGVRDIAVHNASCSDISYILSDIFRHRGLVIAAPTYSDGLFPPVAAITEAIAARGMKNRSILLLGSHTWSQRAVKEMESRLTGCELITTASPVIAKQAADEAVLEQCRAAAAALAATLSS